MQRNRPRYVLSILAVAALALFAVSCGDDDDDDEAESPTSGANGEPSADADGTEPAGDLGEIDVMGIWGDEEAENFAAMIEPWQEQTGGTMQFTGTRDLVQQVTVRAEGGNPPDVVIGAELGLLRQLVADGQVVPLSECTGLDEMVREDYGEAFVDLGSVDGELYGIIMKVDNKGTIFYNPSVFEANGWEPLTEESTWDDLIALAEEIQATGMAPFSMGIESEATTGWVITDWIAQIFLGESDVDTYNGIIDGSVPFTDPAVADAWEKFGQIVHTDGMVAQAVPDGVIATGFMESTYPPFEDPPGAAMVYLGSFAEEFITTQFPDLVAGEDYDFMPFPNGAVTGAFNIAYATNADETTCSFLEYIASADAQQVWVDLGGFNSANNQIDLSGYESPVARKAAEQLLGAETFAGDMDDLVGGDFQNAFFAAALEFLSNPDSLESNLESVAGTQATPTQ